MESQPQNSEFRINPENFHPCKCGDPLCLRLRVIFCLHTISASKSRLTLPVSVIC